MPTGSGKLSNNRNLRLRAARLAEVQWIFDKVWKTKQQWWVGYCTISDISDGGVRIVAENLDVPAEFTLILATGRPRMCRLAWRIGCESGPSSSTISLHVSRSIPPREVARGLQNMRKASSGLIALLLALPAVSGSAVADALVVVPGIRGIGYPGAFGYMRLYGHPFDDGYDYPVGYGEYAEYGPWAYRGVWTNCYLSARRWSGQKLPIRRARLCD